MSATKKEIPQEIKIDNILQEIKMIKCKILNIYKLYFDRDDKEPIQALEVQINNEKETRCYFLKGTETIEFIFGDLIDNKLSNLEYDNNDIPISIKLPDIEPSFFNEYIFDLTFYQSDKPISPKLRIENEKEGMKVIKEYFDEKERKRKEKKENEANELFREYLAKHSKELFSLSFIRLIERINKKRHEIELREELIEESLKESVDPEIDCYAGYCTSTIPLTISIGSANSDYT